MELGTPLKLYVATNGKTRPSMAKVRGESDLLKPLEDNVFLGLEDENALLIGFTQKVEVMEKKRASEIEKNNKEEGLTQSKEGTIKDQNEKGEEKMDNQKNVNTQADDNKKEKATKAQSNKKGDLRGDKIIPETQHKKEVAQDHHTQQRGGNLAIISERIRKKKQKSMKKKMPNKKSKVTFKTAQRYKRNKQDDASRSSSNHNYELIEGLNDKNNSLEAKQTTDIQSNQASSMIKGSSSHNLPNDIHNSAHDPTGEDTSGYNELTRSRN
ncbi:protein PXR1-like [Nicotiana tomentosiformis]|uniref:protein PXR1-like n=1 Tax=Nicotiana tomentosiformis TaxID=4098 RepID=UPI00388CD2B0